jgi:hypothetical protein
MKSAAEVLADEIEDAIPEDGKIEVDVDPVRAQLLVEAVDRIEREDGEVSPGLVALRASCRNALEKAGL